jgi:hypothetical protein
MLRASHLFWWVYELPEIIYKRFDSIWKRSMCARGYHLFDYVFNGYSSLVCDVCGLEVNVIEETNTEDILIARKNGLIPQVFASLDEVKEKDPDAYVIDYEMDNDNTQFIESACCDFLIQRGDKDDLPTDKMKTVLAHMMNGYKYLSSCKTVLRMVEFIRKREVMFEPFPETFVSSKLRIRRITEVRDTGFFNSEVVIMSPKLGLVTTPF